MGYGIMNLKLITDKIRRGEVITVLTKNEIIEDCIFDCVEDIHAEGYQISRMFVVDKTKKAHMLYEKDIEAIQFKIV
ncbi:hypothetical protein [Staphylococcus equorum]|uniref:hypothetical protein n=2 Tax=Staphylococcus equorum TaxID=246432 RepID=UPI000853286F|nr:hypothetical protein [Staphylococcus equorum]MDK9853838.1 hypothetical protein [Staphylococcus equorum]